MKEILIVGFGGFFGSALRYGVYLLLSKYDLKLYIGTLLQKFHSIQCEGRKSGETSTKSGCPKEGRLIGFS
jgi:hypothetical protein